MEGVPFREPEVKGIAMQLLEGLKTMHEENFTHRDLKPQVGRYLSFCYFI
jgi:serine/threonine protein kinase